MYRDAETDRSKHINVIWSYADDIYLLIEPNMLYKPIYMNFQMQTKLQKF